MTTPVLSDRDLRIPDRDPRIPERDTRIDVLRALALIVIFIDHVPGTAFETLTYKNFGFSEIARDGETVSMQLEINEKSRS